MARARTVDGGETGTVTVRLPVWVIEWYETEALRRGVAKVEVHREAMLGYVRGVSGK